MRLRRTAHRAPCCVEVIERDTNAFALGCHALHKRPVEVGYSHVAAVRHVPVPIANLGERREGVRLSHTAIVVHASPFDYRSAIVDVVFVHD